MFPDVLSRFEFSGLSHDVPVTKLRGSFRRGLLAHVVACSRWGRGMY